MKKFLWNAYLWSCYILTAPISLLWLIGIVLYTTIKSKIEFGSFDFKGYVGTAIDGIHQGHIMNKEAIDDIVND